jgi:hypothetical protein
MFISVSILVSFDHTHMMVMKTDFSGWCIGETLLQLMNDVWRPYAYYSKKNASAKCNYEIYDKEMLIIIWCLKQWDTEFKSVSSFQICTDHKIWNTLWQSKSLQSDKWDGLWFCCDTTSSYYTCWASRMREQMLYWDKSRMCQWISQMTEYNIVWHK